MQRALCDTKFLAGGVLRLSSITSHARRQGSSLHTRTQIPAERYEGDAYFHPGEGTEGNERFPQFPQVKETAPQTEIVVDSSKDIDNMRM